MTAEFVLPAAGRGGAAGPGADRVWALLAPTIAGAGRVRLSRDGGRSYPSRWERPLGERPVFPAAVRLYDGAGRARVLALDLDAKTVGRAQVVADCALAVRWLRECGGVPVVDESVSGGRHVYLLLDRARPAEELVPVLRALQPVLPSLDLTPMLNPVTGCLRPPGSAHPRGGSQTLVTPWPDAVRAVNVRADARVWAALLERVHDLAPLTADRGPVTGRVVAPRLEELGAAAGGAGAGGALRGALAVVASTGEWDRARYATGSEARYAVLCSLAARGWTGAGVLAAVESGALPGLRSLYGKYRGRWRRSLIGDWSAAQRAVTPTHSSTVTRADTALRTPAVTDHSGYVSVRNTRELLTHPLQPEVVGNNQKPDSMIANPTAGTGVAGEGEYRWIRIWWACVSGTRAQLHGMTGLSRIAVLHALGAAAQKTGSRTTAFGTRSLALASGVDHSTVSRVLRELREEEDPMVELLEAHRGPAGDLYQLRIPDRLSTVAAAARWPAGRIPGVHPVFRVLGLAAWAAHTALTPAGPVTAVQVEAESGLSRATTYRALDALADAGLARRTPGGWTLGPRSLDAASDLLGGTALVVALQARYAVERTAWRLFLRLLTDRDVRRRTVTWEASGELAEWSPLPPEPPPEPGLSALQLIEQFLGGVLVEA